MLFRSQPDWVTIPSLDLGKLTSLDIFNDDVGVFDDAAWDLGDVAVSSARWIEPGFINGKAYTGLYNATIPGNSTATWISPRTSRCRHRRLSAPRP